VFKEIWQNVMLGPSKFQEKKKNIVKTSRPDYELFMSVSNFVAIK
jgi:hypothetical protein